MNALYVTVSITLLLLLAGFNHAHGLTTFGKTNPSSSNQTPLVPPKSCTNHTECKGIRGTSCVKESGSKKACLCGDNTAPQNGDCQAKYRGPNHVCEKSSECVDGATCKKAGPNEKQCMCHEGFIESANECNGGPPASVLSGVLILLAITRTILY